MNHRTVKILYSVLSSIGFYPSKTIKALKWFPRYIKNKKKLEQQIAKEKKQMPDSVKTFGDPYPIYTDFKSTAGSTSGHYFHQDLIIANYI